MQKPKNWSQIMIGSATIGKCLRLLNSFVLVLFLFQGCATRTDRAPGSRPFVFRQDSLSFSNELVWSYSFDPVTDKASHTPRQPPPTYSHHCFVVARSAKQFFKHAHFAPELPTADDQTYRKLVRKIVSTSPAVDLPEKVVIPGFTNLYTFSSVHANLLKEESGGAWRSYFQRGHWRMVWPFSRTQQQKTAEQLVADIRRNNPPVIHVVRFPQLKINHAVVLFDLRETAETIEFATYDPNVAEGATVLTFDRKTRTFRFPRNDYFVGGKVDVYEIYHRWNY
ncbi:MAG: hypothetical protein JWM16_6073 [Verrucomicrobiales bacterium]|nr:hypothetical protein [Verrucomicrobiales bacterium]